MIVDSVLSIACVRDTLLHVSHVTTWSHAVVFVSIKIGGGRHLHVPHHTHGITAKLSIPAPPPTRLLRETTPPNAVAHPVSHACVVRTR